MMSVGGAKKAITLVAILIALFNFPAWSAAFRIYGVEELLALSKRAMEAAPIMIQASDDNEVGANALLASHDQFYSAAQDDEDDSGEDADYMQDADSASTTTVMARRKRYTEFQESAISICAGDCMYTHRLSYGDCYELCDWNGRTPSPWKKFDKQFQEQQQQLQQQQRQQQQQQQQQVQLVSKVHRFGKLKEQSATSKQKLTKTKPSSTDRGQIRVKVVRPISSKSSVSETRLRPQSKTSNNRQTSKTTTKIKTKIVKPVVGRCTS